MWNQTIRIVCFNFNQNRNLNGCKWYLICYKVVGKECFACEVCCVFEVIINQSNS